MSAFVPPVAGKPGSTFRQPDRPNHQGLDYPVPVGTPVVAIGDGVVRRAADNPGKFGNVIVVDHGVIDGKHTYSLYAHLSEMAVEAGDRVRQGQEIGRSGGKPGTPGAGRTTGPHLHFEIAESIKPLPWSPRAGPMGVLGSTGRVDPLPRIAPVHGPPQDLSGGWSPGSPFFPPRITCKQSGSKITLSSPEKMECKCYGFGGTSVEDEQPPRYDFFEGIVKGDRVEGWIWWCDWKSGYFDKNSAWVKCRARWTRTPMTLSVLEDGRKLEGSAGLHTINLWRPEGFEPVTPPAGGSVR